MNDQVKAYVASFRVKELKQTLAALGLPQSAVRKAELQARIYQYFGEPCPYDTSAHIIATKSPGELLKAEQIMKDIWFGWRCTPPPAYTRTLAERSLGQRAAAHVTSPNATSQIEMIPAGSSSKGGSDGKSGPVNGKLMSSAARPSHMGVIRCICDSSIDRGGRMVQCKGEGCAVLQHCDCLGIGADAAPPQQHFCEQCRAAWADPFWEVKNAGVLPTSRLTPTGAPPVRVAGGSEAAQLLDKAFLLSHTQLELIKKSPDYQLQAVSLLLNDPVMFRYHWPKNADLRINSMVYRVYSRPQGTKVGTNLRDEPANLASSSFVGRNRLRLQVNDSRKFVVLIQLVKRRSLKDVEALMAPIETLEAALHRVKQQVGGDSADDLAIGRIVLSLRDPLSGMRIQRPARFIGTGSLVAFDLDTFLSMTQHSRKWQCPHSMRHTRVQELQLDAYTAAILEKLKDLPEVMEIEVSPEGEWRPLEGGYPWCKINEPLQKPLPDSHEKVVKKEAGEVATGLSQPDAADSDEEELSEGEELRRAAAAYAASARQNAQEVIVLDDSDDDKPPAKRPALANGSEAPRYRARTMQPTLQSNLNAYRRALGAPSGPSSPPPYYNTGQGRAPQSTTAANGYAGSSGPVTTGGGEPRINIRLPNLSHQSKALPPGSNSQLPSYSGSMQQGNLREGVSSSGAPRGMSSGFYTYEVGAPGLHQNPASAPSYLGSTRNQMTQGAWSTMQAPTSPHQHQQQHASTSSPWHESPHNHQIASPMRQHGGGQESMTQLLPGLSRPHSAMRQPPLPAEQPPPLPPENDRLADSWNASQGFTPAERQMLGSLLQDDAISPGTRANVQMAAGLPSFHSSRQFNDGNHVIDLDSD